MDFVVHHRTQGRGAEGVHVAHMTRALRAAGHEVSVVSPPGVDPLETAGAAPVDKAETRERGIRRVWKLVSRHAPQIGFEIAEIAYNVVAWFRLAPVLRSPTVLYERYAFFLFAGAMLARRRGVPMILEVNEVAGIPRAREQVLVGLCRWFERRVFARADRIVTVSGFLRDRIVAQGVDPARVRVVPNAVDESWLGAKTSPDRVRVRHGLDGTIVLGFVGWFDHWDRLDLLVDVVARLREAHPRLRLLLVGDGPEAAGLRERIRDRGLENEVRLAGAVPRDEVASYVEAMDICVLPDSNPFGSPIVLFEFMALGKPVVAPDVGPIRDVIEDRRSGFVVPRGDVTALARAVGRLIEEPELARRVGREARKIVMERHTWAANAGIVASLAAEVARASDRRGGERAGA